MPHTSTINDIYKGNRRDNINIQVKSQSLNLDLLFKVIKKSKLFNINFLGRRNGSLT